MDQSKCNVTNAENKIYLISCNRGREGWDHNKNNPPPKLFVEHKNTDTDSFYPAKSMLFAIRGEKSPAGEKRYNKNFKIQSK